MPWGNAKLVSPTILLDIETGPRGWVTFFKDVQQGSDGTRVEPASYLLTQGTEFLTMMMVVIITTKIFES